MNRELKFRVWDVESKFYWGKGEGMDLKKIAFNFYNKLFIEGALIFQQYTGLKDKNGKDIYEGDIVKVDRFDDLNGEWEGIVKWAGTGWHLFLNINGFNNDYNYALEWRRPVEIIGNIFENPELLK